MAITDAIDGINTEMTAARTAALAGDYKTALQRAEAAWAWAIELPDQMEIENERTTWNLERIEAYIAHVQKRANKTSIQTGGTTGKVSLLCRVPVKYQREGTS